MNKSEIKALLDQYKEGKCSDSERQMVEQWYQKWEPQAFDLSEEELHGDLQLIKNELPRKPRRARVYYQAAAIVTLMVVGISFYFTSNPAIPTSIITTPKGTQYKITLPDGSKVWLNAASSLKFPAVFKGKERKVELNGEAYFEVAKKKGMPFKVKSDRQEVEVLGTHFNVTDYREDGYAKTTLLEGSVRINSQAGQSLLHPGEQADLNKSKGEISITKVSAGESTAIRDGLFVFNNEDIHSIMKKISRWYDVEIVYINQQENKEYSGTVSRFDHVGDVLKMLEMTGTIYFKIEGRKILVMNPSNPLTHN